ncbi:AraC family transcriptional regulator [Paenibacillus psychroresistens]|nr:AraC family transcriptional regulator [Paenibacillus psychroresistens]
MELNFEMLPFLLAEVAHKENNAPLYAICVGSHDQKPIDRPTGYSEHQLFLCKRGSGAFKAQGKNETLLTQGMAYVLPAGVSHSYSALDESEEWELGFVAFNGKASEAFLEMLGERLMSPLDISRFESLWDKLSSLWHLIDLNRGNAYWETSKRVYDMLLFLLEEAAPARKFDKVNSKVAQPNTNLDAAVKLIHNHFEERLLLSNVARSVGYSVQHFHRLFVASYGVTPQRYILQLRMRKGKELFEEVSGITVEKVAQQLGMEPSYFIRMFKRTYGETPKVWNKRR